MGDGAIQDKTPSPFSVVVDLNGDGIGDTVEGRWKPHKNWIGIISYQPVITSAKLGVKNGTPLDLKEAKEVESQGTLYKKGEKRPDSPTKHKSPITRVLTDFLVKPEHVRNVTLDQMEYYARLCMGLTPENYPDGIHKKSSRAIGISVFLVADPNTNPSNDSFKAER